MTTTKEERLQHANELLRIISSYGRRFFWSQSYQRRAVMALRRGRVYHLDEYSGRAVNTGQTPRDRHWYGFSHGGTLRNLVELLRDYITDGTPIHPGYIAPACWAYTAEEAAATQAEAYALPMWNTTWGDGQRAEPYTPPTTQKETDL